MSGKPFFYQKFLAMILALILSPVIFSNPVFLQEVQAEEPLSFVEENEVFSDKQNPSPEQLVVPLALETLSTQRLLSYLHYLLGSTYPNGYCMMFVADVYEDLGASRSTACCASRYASYFTRSTDIHSIPVGADVFFDGIGGGPCPNCGSSYFGHIGIYIGNGRFVHADSGRIQVSLLQEDPYFSEHFKGWGIHGGIALERQEPGFVPANQSGLYQVATQGSHLMLRAGPSVSAPVLVRLADQDLVSISKSSKDWAYVKSEGLSGYVNKAYLEKVPGFYSYPDLDSSLEVNTPIIQALENRLLISPSSYSFFGSGQISRREWIRTLYRMAGSPKDGSLALYRVEREWTGSRWKNKVLYSKDPVEAYQDLSKSDPDVDAIRYALLMGWIKPDSSERIGLERAVKAQEIKENVMAWLEYEGMGFSQDQWNLLEKQGVIPAVDALCTREQMARMAFWAYTL